MSRVAKLGASITCITMAGTPPKVTMRSRSMSSRARSGSQWCIITSLFPAAVFATKTEWHPVAWNSGTDNRYAPVRRCRRPGGALVGERSPARELRKKRLIRLVPMLRWVPTAPLGFPVVPEV